MTDLRSALPSVQRLLEEAAQSDLTSGVSHQVMVDTVRAMLADARDRGGVEPGHDWMADLTVRLREGQRSSLRPVINATGIVLHTNLGRAPLAPAAADAVSRILRYSTLEYDLAAGDRGSRQTHVRSLLRRLTGAEDALAVNNAASALVLVLNALGEGGETIVSRGELVEIGGAFRIPDILRKSGSTLVEVGTTNRTRLDDYMLALSPRTRIVLKVHRSNFTMSGFTSDVEVGDLTALAADRGVAVVHDVGSGLLVDLDDYGLRGEPMVPSSVAAGAVVIFSGDKLLGGPQSGLIVGPARFIDVIARNPFTRAFRPDKVVLGALEATLDLYRDPKTVRTRIPTLAMLTADPTDLARRAAELAAAIPGAGTESGTSSVGGGAFPDAILHTTLVTVATPHPNTTLQRLRTHEPPVIGRAAEDRVLLDPRTVAIDEEPALVRAVRAAQPA